MSRASEYRDGRVSLRQLGYDKSALSLDLAKYLTDHPDVLVKRTDLKRINRGTLFDVYRLTLEGRRERDMEKVTESLVAKVYTGNGASTDFSGFYDQRKDLLEYETTVAMYMTDYVPRYFSHNKKVLIVEDLGGNTLEDILLNVKALRLSYPNPNEPQDSNDLEKLLSNLVTRLAGFHEELDTVIENNKFKRSPTYPNYVDKFELYVNEILEDKYDGDRPLNRSERRIIREAFAPLAEILANGTITGDAFSNGPIHQDCHPAHIFYDDKLNASFIDYKPRRGPVQFDLVDCLVNPPVFSSVKNSDEAIEALLIEYMNEKVKLANKRLGNKTENGIHLSEDVINDSIGVKKVSRVYRDFRAASKGCSIRRKRPEIYRQYVARNWVYPDYQSWHVDDGIETCDNLASNGSKYGLRNGELRALATLTAKLSRMFGSYVGKKEVITQKLGINEEDKIDITSKFANNESKNRLLA